jgi:hypothetical protein
MTADARAAQRTMTWSLLLDFRNCLNATHFVGRKDYLIGCLQGVEHETVLDLEIVRLPGAIRADPTYYVSARS